MTAAQRRIEQCPFCRTSAALQFEKSRIATFGNGFDAAARTIQLLSEAASARARLARIGSSPTPVPPRTRRCCASFLPGAHRLHSVSCVRDKTDALVKRKFDGSLRGFQSFIWPAIKLFPPFRSPVNTA